ncbi:MAG: hypothetical protein ACREO5_02885, partial [Candidatus Binatia bacterium]
AKMALQKMNSGISSDTSKYGVPFKSVNYTYGTKENAIGWMNLVIGYIDYYAKDDKKGALPYIYQASLHGSETTVNPLVFETIGKYFLGETIRLRDEIKVMIQAQDPKDADDVKAKKEADVKAKIAMLKGNAERALDAYSRAYKVAKTDAASKPYRDGLYQTMQQLYNVRFEKTDGLDTYVASSASKPLLDPATPVTPIEEVVKAADTTKTGSAAPAPTPATKPGETSGVTKAAITAKESVLKSSAVTAAKSPAVKKANH